MPEPSSEGIVSEPELVLLTDLFRRFEGAADPFSLDCKNARAEFYDILRGIYVEKVKPEFIEIDFSIFVSMTRRQCRERLSRSGPPFPCP